MANEAGFLAAIRANPEDDAPRLVYADWLDEQGGGGNVARAEYIRLSIELARANTGRTAPPELKAKQKRAQGAVRQTLPRLVPRVVRPPETSSAAHAAIPGWPAASPDKLQCHYAKVLKVGERLMQTRAIH